MNLFSAESSIDNVGVLSVGMWITSSSSISSLTIELIQRLLYEAHLAKIDENLRYDKLFPVDLP